MKIVLTLLFLANIFIQHSYASDSGYSEEQFENSQIYSETETNFQNDGSVTLSDIQLVKDVDRLESENQVFVNDGFVGEGQDGGRKVDAKAVTEMVMEYRPDSPEADENGYVAHRKETENYGNSYEYDEYNASSQTDGE